MTNLFLQPTAVIFDIDGTLANCEHRVRFVQSIPKNWPAFNKRMNKDTPYHDIIWLLKIMHANNVIILIASGRGEEDRKITTNWLDVEAGLAGLYTKLYMRPLKDNRADNIIKKEILDQMRLDGYNPTMAIDDRSNVVKMWRDNGLRCLQVAAGDF